MRRFLLFALTASTVAGQSFNDYEVEPHSYFTAPLKDPMSLLLERLEESGEPLAETEGKPLVKRLLQEMDIPEESQVLVFTKTSLQRRVVTAANPRAIYFNEDVYLGWMPEGRVEITSMDPDLGGIFYFQRPLDRPDQPLFHREDSCLGCHAGSATNFLPGLLSRSVYADAEGRNLKSVATFERSSHEIPIDERWGGWYVTGFHGQVRHLGNVLAGGTPDAPILPKEGPAHVRSLEAFFPPEKHLRGDSDVLALLLLDHQISMHHWIMEAHYRVRQAFFDAGIEGKTRDDLRHLPAYAREDVDASLDRLLRYLVFADEASLGDEDWESGADFRRVFAERGRRDPEGRSLRDLELRERMFRYRCSYMIYSKSFLGLPQPAKEELYVRLHEVLHADVKDLDHFAPGEKKAIAEILQSTLPELAQTWSTLGLSE